MDPNNLYDEPNALAAHYQRFDVGNRLLLTGHSHQAWPDCSEEGLLQSWEDAALHVDEKWNRAFAKAERVQEGIARWMDDSTGSYCLAQNTHELVVRFLSGLPYRERRRIVTTDSEFHSLRRQLDRLEEEGIEIVRVPAHPVTDVADRLVAETDEKTAAVMVSAVFFNSAQIAQGLDHVAQRCETVGAALLIDVYHALGVMPYPLAAQGLDGAYVVGGGYKYLELGGGNAFIRTPPGAAMRPIFTGWFAEFGQLESPPHPGSVSYGTGARRFGGATYDPASHYRAASVLDFFDQHELSPAFLREVSQHQIGLLVETFDALDLDPEHIARDRDVSLENLGGFLTLMSPHAAGLSHALLELGVHTDARNDRLRFGPAPYLSDLQIKEAMSMLPTALNRISTQQES